MTTGKTIVLTIQTFVSKMMSLLFNMLSRFVIAFLPKSKCLLISWLQSLSAVILNPKKIKSVIQPCNTVTLFFQNPVVMPLLRNLQSFLLSMELKLPFLSFSVRRAHFQSTQPQFTSQFSLWCWRTQESGYLNSSPGSPLSNSVQ